MTLRYATLRYATLRYATLRYATLRYATLRYATLRYATLRYATLHCIALHCIALHCIALHCIALHYIYIPIIVRRVSSSGALIGTECVSGKTACFAGMCLQSVCTCQMLFTSSEDKRSCILQKTKPIPCSKENPCPTSECMPSRSTNFKTLVRTCTLLR